MVYRLRDTHHGARSVTYPPWCQECYIPSVVHREAYTPWGGGNSAQSHLQTLGREEGTLRKEPLSSFGRKVRTLRKEPLSLFCEGVLQSSLSSGVFSGIG